VEAVKNLSLKIVEKKQEIEKLNEQSGQINSIRAGYGYMQDEMEKVSDLIVNYQDIIDFIVEVENVAEENGVGLDISASNKEGESLRNNLSYINYSVKAFGNFDNLMHFSACLENLKYFNNVENIRVYYDNENKKNSDDLDEINYGNIVLSANLKVYVKNKDVK
jgi:Tfp pilus assembly protein PilO